MVKTDLAHEILKVSCWNLWKIIRERWL